MIDRGSIRIMLVGTVLLVGARGACAQTMDNLSVEAVRGMVPASPDTLRGKSGRLLMRTAPARRTGAIRVLQELFGDSAALQPGLHPLRGPGRAFTLATMVPFAAKRAGRVGRYHLGTWPSERRGRGDLPEGFIEVTEANQDTPVSHHFRLRDFLTHDQGAVWPKYLVLRDALVDKLELVISDLEERGYRVGHMAVLSGFRTPSYNAAGVRPGGRASDSRHQYGDAADIYVDNDRNGRLDDLNADGRVDMADTRVILESVERVERRYPEFAGGAGLYKSNASHGPFVHVDVRGARVRWGGD